MVDKTEDFVLLERVEKEVVKTPGPATSVVVETPGTNVVTVERDSAVSIEVAERTVITEGQVGPRGFTGEDGGGVEVFVAGEALGGHRVVRTNGSGEAIYADNTDLDSQSILGLTTGAAVMGASVSVLRLGRIEEPSWSWTPTQPVYLGANGVLTQVYPATPLVVIVGVALTATSMFVAPREPILTA